MEFTGVTFLGGVSVVPPTPPLYTFGFSVGGVIVSTTNRITFATDTNTAATRGPLSIARFGFAGSGNSTYGWYVGGLAPNSVTTIDRITYATDTATAALRGTGPNGQSSSSSTEGNYGWFGGFYPNPGTGSLSTIARIDFANDNTAASSRGPMTTPVYNTTGSGNQTHGYILSGLDVTSIQRITYSVDTNTTTTRGTLSTRRYGHGSAQNSTYAWAAGGYSSSSIDRVEFSNDTSTASARGSLAEGTATWVGNGGLSDGVAYGWFVGAGSPGLRSVVQRLSYESDTVTTSLRGPLSAVQYLMAKSFA